ncbi:MAG: hypothetical protein ACI83B_000660 [Sediminicola sp.]|jgi:hypothetical protein
MNYLHIKGGKYSARVKINKHSWEEIEGLVERLTSLKTMQHVKDKESKIIYSVKFLKDNSEIHNSNFYGEVVPK